MNRQVCEGPCGEEKVELAFHMRPDGSIEKVCRQCRYEKSKLALVRNMSYAEYRTRLRKNREAQARGMKKHTADWMAHRRACWVSG